MPGKVAVKVKAGRNLPVMDKSSETTDAYVEIKLGNVIYKTDVCRKSLHPQWNTDWYRFEVDDAELQDEPLQIRLMDYDTYSANDAIGKINISLNPLCKELFGEGTHGKGTLLSGWLPVFDTLHGIRGEVNVTIKMDLFSDSNKFRQSSCGIHFFHSPCIPVGYRAQIIHGFVEELVVNDDPEYQWIDKIRTPRASNEVRQVVFLKLSGQVQRKMGLKAINMGANSIVGYSQYFDLEGDVGVVARGIGTAVTLVKESSPDDMPIIEKPMNECLQNFTQQYKESCNTLEDTGTIAPLTDRRPSMNTSLNILDNYVDASSSDIAASSSNAQDKLDFVVTSRAVTSATHSTAITFKESNDMCRRSSDSDISITTKGNSVDVANDRYAATALMRLGQPYLGKSSTYDGIEMLEYPFLTMTKYPKGFILNIGATVSARSVKLLERIPNPDEPEARDQWWTEIRMEIKSHARALGCNVVLGYSELTTILDDVCILSATGTAAIVNMGYNYSENDVCVKSNSAGGHSIPLEERIILQNADCHLDEHPALMSGTCAKKHGIPSKKNISKNCSICHIPYSVLSLSFNSKLKKCAVCKKGRVPDVLLSTLEVPEDLQVIGQGCFLQAQVIRGKKDLRSEMNAKEISDGLPFLEYELQKLLINKLKTKGMNAIFGLKVEVSVGERVIALVATGTSLFVAALPLPQAPKIVAGNSWTDKQKLTDLQKKFQETFDNNQEIYKVKSSTIETDCKTHFVSKTSDTDDSEEEVADIEIPCVNKETCLLEVDDVEDLEMIALLLESYLPEKCYVVNTEQIPGMHIGESVKCCQLFTQIWRTKLDIGYTCAFQKHFNSILQMILYKLRSMMPCAICNLQFRLDFPDNDQIQLLVIGVALKLEENNKANRMLKNNNEHFEQKSITNNCENNTEKCKTYQTNDIESRNTSNNERTVDAELTDTHKNASVVYQSQALKLQTPASSDNNAKKSYQRVCGIDISTLSSIPGGKIEKYLGNLNFFFIRESTSIRENGGINGFVHGFITELLAIVRAHIVAVGGNAMVSFNLTELDLFDNQHKNQGQCLISIGGDAVQVSFPREQ